MVVVDFVHSKSPKWHIVSGRASVQAIATLFDDDGVVARPEPAEQT